MTHEVGTIPIVLSMQTLELRFVPLADRYAQLIGLNDPDRFVPLVESVEGDPRQDWPPSPPLQEVHCEARPGGGQVALCVGMAGGSHWSLSVEMRPAERLLLFDVACRVKQELPTEQSAERFPLGSSYRSFVPVEQAAGGKLRFETADMLYEVETIPPEQGSCGLLVPEFDAWRIEPADWLHGPLPRTVRWRYTLRQLA